MMKIVVCIKQSTDGEINPFDASAYETALKIDGAEVILLSMGPEKTEPFLENLTRLGAARAILLCDKAFAGADTLATSYALSLAIGQISPDLVLCGRQSVDGDTGQVGPSLSSRLKMPLVTNVMRLYKDGSGLKAFDRFNKTTDIHEPSVVTVEKSERLRLVSIRSKAKSVEIMTAADINADLSLCGLVGSPTRVVKVYENNADRRKCKFISGDELKSAISEGLGKKRTDFVFNESENKLKNVWCVGERPIEYAKTIGENITVISPDLPEKTASLIREHSPDAVLWASDNESKALAPQVAAILNTGLCADCTTLETDGKTLYMYRPACSGNIIAKIVCNTTPPMATVRTTDGESTPITFGIGFGAAKYIDKIRRWAAQMNGEIAATRKAVDNDYLPYELQVGLTGKTIAPDVYVAIGISGAVHHIVGMKQSGTVIAINPDKNAPIFDYADYGIVDSIENISL